MDTKFFTNDANGSLYDRFNQILQHTECFDILVGYFRSSGFHLLQKEFDNIRKVRILVGLNVDKTLFEIINRNKLEKENNFDFHTHERVKSDLKKNLCKEIETADDKKNVEDGIQKFTEYLRNGKIEIRLHLSQNIHAKVYIMRHKKNSMDYGRVITGSSNFSANGLIAQREFNVELKDRSDVDFALSQFERLWIEGVDFTKEYIDVMSSRDDITPYDLYLKFLFEYFKEELNDDKENIEFPKEFMKLKYQKEAVIGANRILKKYNGVFLSDVVGLGKTYITCLLLKNLEGKKLIICPPKLKEYWTDTLKAFEVSGHEVISSGSLSNQIKKETYNENDYVVIDEAHNFRNEMTQSWTDLYTICNGKKVILVSATPLNNSLKDIEAQLKLFTKTQKSNIAESIEDLDSFFREAETKIKKAKKEIKKAKAELKKDESEENKKALIDKEISFSNISKKYATKVREDILRNVMIRRTRTEIKQFYENDLKQQGLSFPKILTPKKIIYKFNDEVEAGFNETIKLLKDKFDYSRYTPLLYLNRPASPLEEQRQRNVGGFMKQILVKRLESSFFSFRKTVDRFIKSYELFIKSYKKGNVFIGKSKVFDWLENEDFERIEKEIKKEGLDKYESSEFKPELLSLLNSDLITLKKISSIWSKIKEDPKIDAFIDIINSNKVLRENKLIVFSEAKETTDYLYEKLSEKFPNEVFAFSGSGGKFKGENFSARDAKAIIEKNYTPQRNSKLQKNEIRILLTTDVLAEGVNLHRSNVIINYDLPWNPTKVLQRVGRVNRVGTEHTEVHIFNCFPTTQSDNHLGLKENIMSKINAFHNVLGEDAKYLSEDETLMQHLLTGNELLEEDSNAGNSKLKYLKLLRSIRDNDKALFERLKKLPKKIKATQNAQLNEVPSLLTFFKKGHFFSFVYATKKEGVKKLTFKEAVEKFECQNNEENIKLPKDYYELLALNKEYLENLDVKEVVGKKGTSNIRKILDLLDGIKNYDGFSEEDKKLIHLAEKDIKNGSLNKFPAKELIKELKTINNPKEALNIIKKYEKDWKSSKNSNNIDNSKEIILSKCFYKGVK
ncbi:MAG: helicase-related protein [Alphaproteobacteria bacterium]